MGHQRIDLTYAVAQQLPAHHCVLPTSEIRVKTHTQFEESSYTALYADIAGSGMSGAGNDLEQCALSSTIDPHDAHGLTWADLKIQILQYPFEMVPRFFQRA